MTGAIDVTYAQKRRGRRSQFLEYVEYDWAQVVRRRMLHFPSAFEVDHDYEVGGKGTTICGIQSWLSIPGPFTRMGARRCPKCCDALGYPHGIGSPKNDLVVRPLMFARIGGE